MLRTVEERNFHIIMNMKILRTDRLELVPITEELCIAEISSQIALGEKLRATIPDSWPPELVTQETLHEFITLLTAPGGSRFFSYYWIKTGQKPVDRILIGSGGFLFKEDDTPELGYSVLEEFQCRGYATEAVRMLLLWLKTELSPCCIHAYTYPSLRGSIRVLEKNGFRYTGPGAEGGTMEFLL